MGGGLRFKSEIPGQVSVIEAVAAGIEVMTAESQYLFRTS